MNDKIIEAARFCKESNETDCFRCNGNNDNCIAEYSFDDLRQCLNNLSDRLDALTAELAEKDKRIAELEAGQKHGKWVDDGHYCCKCTACGNHVLGNTSESLRRYNFRPYCENCGAKMDGE